jgi:isoleucyl-tRNA synthetase
MLYVNILAPHTQGTIKEKDMPDPVEVATATALADRLWDLAKWLAPSAAVMVAWVWKASKEHSRVQNIEKEQVRADARADAMEKSIDTIEQTIKTDLISKPEHELMQERCQEHLIRLQADRLHSAVLEMKGDYAFLREELSVMNANICRLMGRFNVEPIEPKSKARRKNDLGVPPVL